MRFNERIHGLRTERRSRQQTVPINKVVTCLEQRPVECSRCHGKKIYRFGRLSQTVYDLKVSGAAVRRWVVQYSFQRYICWNSKAAFQLHSRQLKCGITFRAFVVYHLIDLLLPQRALARSMQQLFRLRHRVHHHFGTRQRNRSPELPVEPEPIRPEHFSLV